MDGWVDVILNDDKLSGRDLHIHKANIMISWN